MNFTRRSAMASTALLLAGLSTGLPASASQAKPSPVILVLGDSLSAEYGLPRGSGWVNLLDQKLQQEGMSARLVNASISGETTSGGVTRLPALLRQHRPSHVVLELGANDALRGLSLQATRSNLERLVEASQKAGAQVVLVGMQVPPNYGKRYTESFAQLFPAVAKERGTALVPFFLQGVADRPDAAEWFQSDRTHPIAQAHPIMMAHVWQALRPLLLAGKR